MAIEMIEPKYMLGIGIVILIVFSVLSLVVWGVILLLHMKAIDNHFDSPDFPHRGLKGLWPWEMGRAASYGAFLLFRNSKVIQKKFPHACKTIKLEDIPKKIKLMVAFPIYTYVPSALLLVAGGTFLYIKKWFL